MKLKYNIEIDLSNYSKLLPDDLYLREFGYRIKQSLISEKRIKDIKIEGIMEL